jgi:hypothetical protein
LSESAAAFPYGEVKQYFEKVGFIDDRYLKLCSTIYSASKK